VTSVRIRRTLVLAASLTSFLGFALLAGCPSDSGCDRCGEDYVPDTTVVSMSDAGSDSEVDAEPLPEANACQAQGRPVCAADQPERSCYHDVLVDLVCTTERGEALSDAIRCMTEHSSGIAGCGTFADPSGARDCVREALSVYDVDAALPVAEIVAERCDYPDADEALFFYGLPLATLSQSTLDALSPCILAAEDCADVDACFETRFPEVFGCF